MTNLSEEKRIPEVQVLRSALELIWRIHVKSNVHMGLERASGIPRQCIPCICAGALGRLIDFEGIADEQIIDALAELRSESHG